MSIQSYYFLNTMKENEYTDILKFADTCYLFRKITIERKKDNHAEK